MTSKERGLYTLATYRTLRVGVCLETGMWGCAPVAAAVGCRCGRGPSTPSGTFLCGRGHSTPSGTGILSPDAQLVPARSGAHPAAWNVPGQSCAYPTARNVPAEVWNRCPPRTRATTAAKPVPRERNVPRAARRREQAALHRAGQQREGGCIPVLLMSRSPATPAPMVRIVSAVPVSRRLRPRSRDKPAATWRPEPPG